MCLLGTITSCIVTATNCGVQCAPLPNMSLRISYIIKIQYNINLYEVAQLQAPEKVTPYATLLLGLCALDTVTTMIDVEKC